MTIQAIRQRIQTIEKGHITSVFSLYELEALYLILNRLSKGGLYHGNIIK